MLNTYAEIEYRGAASPSVRLRFETEDARHRDTLVSTHPGRKRDFRKSSRAETVVLPGGQRPAAVATFDNTKRRQ